MSALFFGAIPRADAAIWTTINGSVSTRTGTPVCAMVLANGQQMFSCDGGGNYNLSAPPDSDGLITLQVFASGFATFRQTLTADPTVNFNVIMDRDTAGRSFTITHFVSPPLPNGWVTVSGKIDSEGTPLCALILINGQSMFSCNQSLGLYSLEVPRDSNGKITLQAFAAGFMPHRDTFGVNDPPIATGQCSTTFQADTFSGTLLATDPDSAFLTYSLPNGSTDTNLTTAKGVVTITDPTTGDFTYEPLINGDRGRDTFTYKVTDSSGKFSTATETIIIGQTVMPLGDSITVGDTGIPTTLSTVGYRKPLYDTLIASAFPVDFVGSGPEGSAVPNFDFNHEGHGGWTASEIAWGGGPGSDPNDTTDGVYGWLTGNPADVVLLHAGTNGLTPNGDIDVEAILDEIDRWELDSGSPVTVILALIIDQDPLNTDVTDFNNNVSIMANDRINNAGDDIIIVDQQNDAGLVYTIGVDMGDKKHPNASGYNKMATIWFNTLTNVLERCP